MARPRQVAEEIVTDAKPETPCNYPRCACASMRHKCQSLMDAQKENDKLRRALQTSPCPHPCTEDDGTVADCIKNDNCGCDNRACLAAISGEK